MNTEELLGQCAKVGLNVAGPYVEYHFKQYHASRDQSQKVHWICPYISRHLLSLNPLQARCRRYSRGER